MSRDLVPVFIFSESDLYQDHREEKIPLELHLEQPLKKNPVKPQHSSNPISIPPQVIDERVESVSRLYDCATWNMYNRIMLHRMNLKSGARKEHPTSVTLSHLLKPKVEGANKSVELNTQDTVKAQQESYCHDTKEHDWLQFELDDD